MTLKYKLSLVAHVSLSGFETRKSQQRTTFPSTHTKYFIYTFALFPYQNIPWRRVMYYLTAELVRDEEHFWPTDRPYVSRKSQKESVIVQSQARYAPWEFTKANENYEADHVFPQSRKLFSGSVCCVLMLCINKHVKY